jgi:hypothetical protein
VTLGLAGSGVGLCELDIGWAGHGLVCAGHGLV